ncbi:N-acetylmuramidase domain-containing protein [Sphingomonas sp. 2R-10]|uniref:N-acetylmuramidase domain-containing protein n=1 Tax=Sphingomonas sp. 2R-10 TaxID=3045148 RepID=UPI0013DE601D|nr:N-acetylmuramidase domain-containing protein [Sphingomonas sp. 2R-10]MDJ0276634.1 N-acetylmuramidase domain-containing protein [Sphingomonas sp. 2R-10]
MAAAPDCEVAPIRAVVATEAVRGAFDGQGRPTILLELHKFYLQTNGRFATSDPDICNAGRGGYGKFPAQYPKLEPAMKLDRAAALKSASRGAFQILGENHVAAVDRRDARLRSAVLFAALLVGACGAAPEVAEANVAAPSSKTVATAPAPVAEPSAAPVTGEVKLAGPAANPAVVAVEAEAKRQGLANVAVTTAQSFQVSEAGRAIATLVTGKGTMPDAPYAGCFVAIVRNAAVQLIPTIGHGEYEAETCGGPSSVGLLSSRDPIRFGIVFDASSPNTEAQEPIVVNWNRATNALGIDKARSTAASEAGATTIAEMRRTVRP